MMRAAIQLAMALQTSIVKDKVSQIDPARLKAYEDYFETLVPVTTEDVFRRWMFAYSSVHTTWEMNCRLYEALAPLDWLGNEDMLHRRISDSKAGMHNNRTRFITQFTDFFWRHPTWFNKIPDESWFEYRNRIMERSPGIGLAKSAFFIELTCFHKAKLACFDTHMVQMYGFTAKQYGAGKVRGRDFDRMERHWVSTCARHRMSPVTARWVLWDQKQKMLTPRYWSYILEPAAKQAEIQKIFQAAPAA